MLYYDFCRLVLDIGLLKKSDVADKNILLVSGFSSMDSRAEKLFMNSMYTAGAAKCQVYCTGILAGAFDFSGAVSEMVANVNAEFDVVIVWDSLEKQKNILSAINNIKVMCRPGGVIFVFGRTPQLLGNTYGVVYYEDYWRFDCDMLADMFNEFFVQQEIKTSNGIIEGIKLKKGESRDLVDIAGVKIYHNPLKKLVALGEVKYNCGYFADYTELESIGERKITDKSICGHNYLEKYEFFLQKFRSKKFNLLELGVALGGSLATWKEYFPLAEITGVDIDEECRQFSDDRVNIIIADLSDEAELNKLHRFAPHVIVDDASHLWSHQIKALFNLWPCLPSGGIYIIEDMETSLNMDVFPGYDDFSIDAYEVCSRIAKVVASKEPDDASICCDDINRIGMETELVSIMHGSCVLIKR